MDLKDLDTFCMLLSQQFPMDVYNHKADWNFLSYNFFLIRAYHKAFLYSTFDSYKWENIYKENSLKSMVWRPQLHVYRIFQYNVWLKL